MAQLDYMEKRGSGLKRIYNETKTLDGYNERLKPVFKSSPSQFMTIIYSVEYDVTLNDGVNGPINGPINSLNDSLKEVYLVVLNNPGIKIDQVAEIRRKSESTVKKQLAELKQRGLIEYHGAKKTGGYYVKDNRYLL